MIATLFLEVVMKNTQPTGSVSKNLYLVEPKSGSDKGVLVIHAWWGLNTFFKGFCERLAEEGFVALAPDLYHGATASTIEEAEILSSKLKQDRVSQEIIQAAEQLQAICRTNQSEIGVVGFSLGGYWALWAARQKACRAVATVVFYATRGGDYADSRSAFQFHFAEMDDYESASGVKKLQKSLKTAGREAEFYTYPGTTHWFFESDRQEAYNPSAAELAWSRTIEFLKRHIGAAASS
jgi:carboxymethylenebutenolidase